MRKQFLAVTIGILLFLSTLSILSLPVGATTLFSDNFEVGNGFGPWTGATSTYPVASTTYVHHGVNSSKIITDGSNDFYCYKDFTQSNTVNARFYFYPHLLSSSTLSILWAKDTTNGVYMYRLHVTGATHTLELWYTDNSGSYTDTSATTISLDIWASLKVKFVSNDGAGEYRVYKDGTEVSDITHTGLNTSGFAANRLMFGAISEAPVGCTIYYDCCEIANVDISEEGDAAPTYSSIGTNTTVAGAVCNFTVTLADETALANYTFGSNNTGTWTNESWTTISGISYKANSTYTLNSTVGNLVRWEYWFSDSGNNTANTGIQSLTTTATASSLTIRSTPISVSYTVNGTALGDTYYAASGSAANVQTAVNTALAAGGGTIMVPAGDFTWTVVSGGSVQINLASLISGSWLNIIGAGGNSTALTCYGDTRYMPTTIFRSAGNDPNGGDFFYVQGAENRHIRFSGFALLGHPPTGYPSQAWTGVAGILLKQVDTFRCDNLYLDTFDNGIMTWGSKGVIDHCSFDCTTALHNSINGGYGIGVYGNSALGGSWQSNLDVYLGKWDTGLNYTYGPVYIEDSEFHLNRHEIASAQYGYYVVRHCYFGMGLSDGMGCIDIHGQGPGGRGIEAYNNEITGGSPGFMWRGGGGVVFSNNVHDTNVFMMIFNENSTSYESVHDLWIWGNTITNCGAFSFPAPPNPILSTDWFSDISGYISSPAPPRSGYTSYTYPHPLTVSSLYAGTTNTTLSLQPNTYVVTVPAQVVSGDYTYDFAHWQDASTNPTLTFALSMDTTITATYVSISVVTVVVTAPTNTTYDSPLIYISFSASGGTIDQYWFNIKNGSTWIYALNQTYVAPDVITGYVNGTHYTGYFWANNTDGTIGVTTIMFTVEIPLQPIGGTNSLIVNVWWGNFW